MSAEYLSKTWDDKSLHVRAELLVMMAIGNAESGDGLATISMENLAFRARATHSKVRQTLDDLVAKGKLSIPTPNTYRIL